MGIAALTSMSTVSSGKEYTELFAAPAIDRTKGASCLHFYLFMRCLWCVDFFSLSNPIIYFLSVVTCQTYEIFFSVCVEFVYYLTHTHGNAAISPSNTTFICKVLKYKHSYDPVRTI
jgi:hypothetical protein